MSKKDKTIKRLKKKLKKLKAKYQELKAGSGGANKKRTLLPGAATAAAPAKPQPKVGLKPSAPPAVRAVS